MGRATERLKEHEHRSYALLNDIYSKSSLDRERVKQSAAFLLLFLLSLAGLVLFVLTLVGTVVPSPGVAYALGLTTAMCVWRAAKRMGMFQLVDEAYRHGGTRD